MENAIGSPLEWYDPRLTRKERARLINRAYRELRRQQRKANGTIRTLTDLGQSQNSTSESSSEEEVIVQEQVQLVNKSPLSQSQQQQASALALALHKTSTLKQNTGTSFNKDTHHLLQQRAGLQTPTAPLQTTGEKIPLQVQTLKTIPQSSAHDSKGEDSGSLWRTSQDGSPEKKTIIEAPSGIGSPQKRVVSSAKSSPPGKREQSKSKLQENDLIWLERLQKTRDKYGINSDF